MSRSLFSRLSATIESHTNTVSTYKIENSKDLESFRLTYLAQKGILRNLFEEFKNLRNEEKRELGKSLNALKKKIDTYYTESQVRIEKGAIAVGTNQDISLPAYTLPAGSRHPISSMQRKIIRIFSRLGFTLKDGPEIEDDWHNFTALNMPSNHPARDMQDTFYVADTKKAYLLRTHTSNAQIRAMREGKLPLRMVCTGRVYRNETISARAHCFFHQVEGLYVDTQVSFSDLKQLLYFFTQELFGKSVAFRLRPSYFPFTEPSAEMDISCLICKGKGCAVCKHTGWLEILGCGMVHPEVLNNCGIDEEKYKGFAFGLGIERIAMLVYRVTDIRLFSENRTQFLSQFARNYF